jgi:hypothetical protein
MTAGILGNLINLTHYRSHQLLDPWFAGEDFDTFWGWGHAGFQL